MRLIDLLGLALGLTMDVFSVSIAVGLTLVQPSVRQRFRLTFHFALFHFFMPVLGWLAGMTIRKQIESFDHWVAFGLLTAVGVKMIWQSRGEGETFTSDPTRGITMVILCFATSVDAMALGVSTALIGVNIWQIGVLLGLSAALMTSIGMNLGSGVGQRLQKWAHIVGGIAVIGVGAKILIEDLMV